MEGQKKWLILTGVILAILLSSLDQTIVATAMPRIVQDLSGMEHLSWVFTAYMLGATVTVPIYGKLSDMFGRRNLYIIAIIIFLAASALCGMAATMNQLILFRGLQGIGGGAMMVNSFAIIGDVFPPAERGKYQGLIGGVFGLSSVAGPLLGGWITDSFSWRWVFFVNLPLGAIAIIVLLAALLKINPTIKDRRIDYWGSLLIALTLVPLLLALVWGGSMYPWFSWPIMLALALAGASFLVFLRIEKKVPNPVLSLDLFKNRVFTRAALAIFITAMGMYGAILYVPIFAQGVIGVSATYSGLILTPMMLALVITSAVAGQIISRTGRYKVLAIAGMAITVFAMFYFSQIRVTTSNTELAIHMIVLGIGLGPTMPIFTLAIQSAFAQERLGEVTAGGQLFRNIGGTVGTAILGGIMNSRLAVHMRQLENEPFVAYLQQLPLQHYGAVSGSLIQNVLDPAVQQQITSAAGSLPPAEQEGIEQSFERFLAAAKLAYTDAMDTVFFVSGILMVVGLVAVFFLPEIPLRKSNKPVLEEVGLQLEEDFGQSDDLHEPRRYPNGGVKAEKR